MERAKQLHQYIESLSDFKFQLEATNGYEHMGAIVVDAGLQAGIKCKTADYFKILMGIKTSAIDRRLYTFFEQAGVKVHDYTDAKLIVDETAIFH